MRISYGTKWSRTDRWTREEDIELMAAYISGASGKRMMKLFRRSDAGIRRRLRILKDRK